MNNGDKDSDKKPDPVSDQNNTTIDAEVTVVPEPVATSQQPEAPNSESWMSSNLLQLPILNLPSSKETRSRFVMPSSNSFYDYGTNDQS